jgi:hypothetical protein
MALVESPAGLLAKPGVTSRLRTWLGPERGLKQGETLLGEAAGRRFIQAADGSIRTKRTLGGLAPSEAIQSVAASATARLAQRSKAANSGATFEDDFYAAAMRMATGEQKLKAAIVNGFGEGAEEAAQAVLEPWSHDASPTLDAVVDSWLYGTAAGLGMSLGTARGGPSMQDRLYQQAYVAQYMKGEGTELDRKHFDSLSPSEQRRLAAIPKGMESVVKAAARRINDDLAIEDVTTVADIYKYNDALRSEFAKETQRLSESTDRRLLVTGQDGIGAVDGQGNRLRGETALDSAVMSLPQVGQILMARSRGIEIQLEAKERALTAAANDPEVAAQLNDEILGLNRMRVMSRALIDMVVQHGDLVAQALTRGDEIAARAHVDEINELLQDASHGRYDPPGAAPLTPEDRFALAQAATIIFSRSPKDSSGSFQMLIPFASYGMTRSQSHNQILVSHAILKQLSGDFDGDMLRAENQLFTNEESFRAARSGMSYMGAEATVSIPLRHYDETLLNQMAQAIASNDPLLEGAAEGTIQAIVAAIEARFVGTVSPERLGPALTSFASGVRGGDTGAFDALLQTLAKFSGGAITEKGWNELSNEWLWATQVFQSNLQSFQARAAVAKASRSVRPVTDQDAPVEQTAEVIRTQRDQAAQPGMTLGLWLAGTAPFRKRQKLHYTALHAAVESGDQVTQSQLQDLAQFYAELATGATQSELDRVSGRDDITARVEIWLRRLAQVARDSGVTIPETQTMAVLANIRVKDVILSPEGVADYNGPEVSLLQMLLKRSINIDKSNRSRLAAYDADLQAKYNRLEELTKAYSVKHPVTAERAFLEVLGHHSLYDLLGNQLGPLAGNLTANQMLRKYASMHELDRREWDNQFKDQPEYKGRDATENLPYRLDEVRKGQISAYRSVVDSVIAVGHMQLTASDQGVVSGLFADQSDRTSKTLHDIHHRVQQAVQQFAELNPSEKRRDPKDTLRSLMTSDLAFSKALLSMIPDELVPATYKVKDDGSLWVANWFYETFTIADVEVAEMHYLRNLLLSKWRRAGFTARDAQEARGSNVAVRQYGKLDSRLLRIVYNLAAQPDGILLGQFLDQLTSASSVSEFMAWVNRTPGVRGEQAPLVAWVDDTADFDPDKADGGWAASSGGSTLRQNLRLLADSTSRLLTQLEEETAAWIKDGPKVTLIQQALDHQSGRRKTVTQEALDALAQWKRQRQDAERAMVGMGPTAMVYQIAQSLYGLEKQSHTKGKVQPSKVPIGQFELWRDAVSGYVSNQERTLSQLTSQNLDDVTGHLHEALQDTFYAMDDDGAVVTVEKPDDQTLLNMYRDPATRNVARMMLFPTVMEVNTNGGIGQQLLLSRSLTEHLESTNLRELFRTNAQGELDYDAANRYLSFLDARARKHGGHLGAQRLAGALAIARTSAQMNTAEEPSEAAAQQAVIDIARAYQVTAAYAATVGGDAAEAVMTDLFRGIKAALGAARKVRLLGEQMFQAEATKAEALELIELDAKQQFVQATGDAMSQLANATTQVEVDRIMQELNTATSQYQSFISGMATILDGHRIDALQQMFLVSESANTPEDTDRKLSIAAYVRTNAPRMIRRTAAATKEIEQFLKADKEAAGGEVVLPPATWDVLGRAVIALSLEEETSATANSVGVALYPDATHQEYRKYYDTSFSYLAQPMFDVDNAEFKAAVELHVESNNNLTVTDTPRVLQVLRDSVLNLSRLGLWTADIPAASIYNEEGIDAASSEPSVAAYGNIVKRFITISQATKRTFRLPTLEMLSTTKLTRNQVNSALYQGRRPTTVRASIAVEAADGTFGQLAQRIPLAQLNNRFVKSALLTYVDAAGQPQQVDLLGLNVGLGQTWLRNPDVAASGFQEITLDRLRDTIDLHLASIGRSGIDYGVDLEFFHPDSQPSDKQDEPTWFNNIFFEGTSFELSAADQQFDSLTATAWMATGGINQLGQRLALDSAKKAKKAFTTVERISSTELASMEAGWESDLATVIRTKTDFVMTTEFDTGVLNSGFYNAMHKHLKLRHWVAGEVDGKAVLWPAEKVIAWQHAHPGEPLPLDNATLWKPSDDVLRTMLGELGDQGVVQPLTGVDVDFTKIKPYTGANAEMEAQFAEGALQRKDVGQTRVAGRLQRMVFEVRAMIPRHIKAMYNTRMQVQALAARETYEDRADATMNRDDAYTRAVSMVGDFLNAENIPIALARQGLPLSTPAQGNQTAGQLLLAKMTSMLKGDGSSMAWIISETEEGNPARGVLNPIHLENQDTTGRPAFRVVYKDFAVVNLASFEGIDKEPLESNPERVLRILDRLMDAGAFVALGDTKGRARLAAIFAQYMEERGYSAAYGSSTIFMPRERTSRFQNLIARESTLRDAETFSANNMHIILLDESGLVSDENSIMWNPRSKMGVPTGRSLNMLPMDALSDYNVPINNSLSGVSQVEDVREKLLSLDNEDGRALLRELAGERKRPAPGTVEALAAPADNVIEFDDALDDLFAMLQAQSGSVLPSQGQRFGTGSLIPRVNRDGHIVLYRHGFAAPDVQKLKTDIGKHGIAVYTNQIEDRATAHVGLVRKFSKDAQFGWKVELSIPFSHLGDKKQLEMNGMKYTATEMTKVNELLPAHPLLPNREADGITDRRSSDGKEADRQRIDNHRDAIAFFGKDFTQDITEAFFPGQGNDARANDITRAVLTAISRNQTKISLRDAQEILRSRTSLDTIRELLHAAPSVAAAAGDQGTAWIDTLDFGSPQRELAMMMIVYLMTPGASLKRVLKSGSFADTRPSSVGLNSLRMDSLFTDALDQASESLHQYLIDGYNRILNNPVADGTGYYLTPDWRLEVTTSVNGELQTRSYVLQVAETHSSGDNPVLSTQTLGRGATQQVSYHDAASAQLSVGFETTHSKPLRKTQALIDSNGIAEFSSKSENKVRPVLEMFQVDAQADNTYEQWKAPTPGESMRIRNARQAVTGLRQAVSMEGWEPEEKSAYQDARLDVVRTYQLKDSQVERVDFWVRQMLGSWVGVDSEGNTQGKVYAQAAVQAAREVLWNAKNGYLPAYGSAVPLTHLSDLQAIFFANQGVEYGWKPAEGPKLEGKHTKWSEWVNISLGSSIEDDVHHFDDLYLLATDGMFHSYRGATAELFMTPASLDERIARQLLDPQTNEWLISLDRNVNTLTSDPAILDSQRATYTSLVGGERIDGAYRGKMAPKSELAKQLNRRREWRAALDVPHPVEDVTVKNFREFGSRHVNHNLKTHRVAQVLLNMRAGMAMMNPALWTSALLEVSIRNVLDDMGNLLTGESTGGVARAAAKSGAGNWLARYGIEQVYTLEDMERFHDLYKVLGQRADFTSMIYRDLMYLRSHHPQHAIGRVERATEGFAAIASRMQDPTYGIPANRLARIYIEAVLQHINAQPTLNPLSADTLVAEMHRDPTFLKERYPQAHQAGTNAVAQVRSLKQTPLSMVVRKIYEPLASSDKAAVNLFGNLVLKMPLMFAGYGMNVATTITGMQGVSDTVAMFLDGRKKFWRKHADPSDKAAYVDMSQVIEGIDLSRSIVRSGITLTSLFQMGLIAGGLGLSGEDDETKRRRRAAELQGAGFLYDPRKLENDFRNADAIFLDWLPAPLQSMFQVKPGAEGQRPMVQLHWMLNQFVSPIQGFERFYETGDLRQIYWGFQSAINSFPLINTTTFSDIVQTSQQLAQAAADADQEGTVEGTQKASRLLSSIVWSYERMLLENSFVNTLYVGMDDFDRDPFVLPAINETGDQLVDAQGNPLETSDLVSYVDEDGNVRQGYRSRTIDDAQVRVMTENRFTAALVGSLFTGLTGGGNPMESDLFRSNMAVKTRKFTKPDSRQLEDGTFVDMETLAKGAIVDTLMDAGGVQSLSLEEAEKAARSDMYDATGEYYGNDKQIRQVALSKMDEAGREILTKDGARAIYDGLYGGSVTMHDASLNGIYITTDMRNEIQKEWMNELIQQGVDMGLMESQAKSRFYRLWYGQDGGPGIRDLLWSKEISSSQTVEYQQLNTTYIMGPDGKPWATGFTRTKLLGALGLAPLQKPHVPQGDRMGTDARGNSVDYIMGMNLGLRALTPIDEQPPGEADDLESAMKSSYKPSGTKKGYSGGYSRRGYGGGGGYYSGGYANFTRMYPLPGMRTPYGNDIPFINTSNPLLRRADIRRERVWSERGRLKQWQ